MYRIKLPVFEGPFDLLLFLIRKHEIDIYDIPIAQITREFLEYIELMTLLDLEIAGEFIEMVATLILIKARMLLPNPVEENIEDVEDPRLQLTLQLLEYRRFKEAGESLQEIEADWRDHHPRHTSQLRKQFSKNEEETELTIEASLFDLLTAFKRALDNMPKITVHQVKTFKVKLEEQVSYLIAQLSGKKQVFFGEIVKDFPDKIYLVVTFMAVLELMRVHMLSAKQSSPFEDIRLVPQGELSMSRYLAMHEGEEALPFGEED